MITYAKRLTTTLAKEEKNMTINTIESKVKQNIAEAIGVSTLAFLTTSAGMASTIYSNSAAEAMQYATLAAGAAVLGTALTACKLCKLLKAYDTANGGLK